MVWQFIKRHRRKFFVLSLLAGGGYAAVRYINGKMVKLFHEQEKMLTDWKKQLYYEHNRDMSLRTSTDIFVQVVVNINRTFQCDTIRDRLTTISDSTQKRELWEQLRVECFARLFTFAYSSSFILALTELVVSALSGRLYSQSQLQHTSTAEPVAAAAATTSKSLHAESAQTQSVFFSRDIQLACLDVIRYATDAGMNSLIEDVRNATQSILSRIPLQQMLDINDVIWYCSEIRHQIEKKRHQHSPINASQHPLLKYVRSPSLAPRQTQPVTTTTTTTASFSLSNVVSTASALFTNRTHPPPVLFNIQQQFELECIEMIESESFQRVLIQIVEQSFSNIYDEFAREMLTISSDVQQSSTLINPQFPLAKIIPMSNNIYTKLSGHHEQLLIHFQSLSCRPELHDYTKYAYDLFSNESPQSPSRTAYSLLPTSSIPFDLSSFLHSWMAPH